jgi:hypothetical protein
MAHLHQHDQELDFLSLQKFEVLGHMAYFRMIFKDCKIVHHWIYFSQL